MRNIDSIGHVTGRSVYLDDIPTLKGTLYGIVLGSPIAHGTIEKLDYLNALKLPGVVRIINHLDIPGENQVGAILKDEPLFAEKEVHYVGQPIALIIAEEESIAQRARKLIKIKISDKECNTDSRIAYEKREFIQVPRTFRLGEPEEAWTKCSYVFQGKAESNGQEHLYLETQGAYAKPMETGKIIISSSTQGPTSVQRIAARVLGVEMHKIEVDVVRLGGAFGGKEDQATPWAVMAALAVQILNKPVKVVLDRKDDIKMTGKRHPYTSEYKIGLSKDLKILVYEVKFIQNAGAAADLSPAILERTLFHTSNSYFIPHVKATAYSCRTNLPPNTAFRGFGAPQAMFVIESAIAHAASELGVPSYIIQKKNLLKNGDEFPYGQIANNVPLNHIWSSMENDFNISEVESRIQKFNEKHFNQKKGFSFMPICFGISFTKTQMNQARALVHIYSDGSVGISTGAVEMGQGVNTKLVQLASYVLGLDPQRIKIESTNTTRVSNTSPSAASSTADLNGKALQKACLGLLNRLKIFVARAWNVSPKCIEINEQKISVNGEDIGVNWDQLIEKAFLGRICLTENAHYATPKIHFDKHKEKGSPFAYHVYGLALTEVTLDCLRGSYTFDSVKIIHDFGKQMNEPVDIGQVEGGLIQGMGWMTMEELVYEENGILASNSLSNYKVPDIYSVPKEVFIQAADTGGNEMGILKSKAVGEPPLMYGIGAYFAIDYAIRAFNPNFVSTFDAPFTHEKVLLALYAE